MSRRAASLRGGERTPGSTVAFGEQPTCAAEARGPYSARLTHLYHSTMDFAVMHNATVPNNDVLGCDLGTEGSTI